jgi:hypothetical protein
MAVRAQMTRGVRAFCGFLAGPWLVYPFNRHDRTYTRHAVIGLLAKLCAHFGLQDAARKWRERSREPGPWARVVSHSKAGELVHKLVTQVRWDKMQHVLAAIMDFFCSGISGRAHWDMAPWAHLESAQGLLIYVPRMYTSMIPDLKGLHLTIDSRQPNRMKTVGIRQVDILGPRPTTGWSRRWLLLCLSRLCLGLNKICVPWVSSRIPPWLLVFKYAQQP